MLKSVDKDTFDLPLEGFIKFDISRGIFLAFVLFESSDDQFFPHILAPLGVQLASQRLRQPLEAWHFFESYFGICFTQVAASLVADAEFMHVPLEDVLLVVVEVEQHLVRQEQYLVSESLNLHLSS